MHQARKIINGKRHTVRLPAHIEALRAASAEVYASMRLGALLPSNSPKRAALLRRKNAALEKVDAALIAARTIDI